MTAVQERRAAQPIASETDYDTLAARFRPLFADIAEGVVERERDHVLPYEQIDALKRAGFGAVRVPRSHGGSGASIPQLFRLLVELSAADSNITQALRGHFAFVEDRLVAADGPGRDTWLRRFADGQLVGNAWTEIGDVPLGEANTKVSPVPGEAHFFANGTKYYSTGSIFADWIDLYSQRTDTGAFVIAAVEARQPAVTHSDDWNGFGQQTTGSGTSTYENAIVQPENIFDFSTRFKYQTAFYQLFHLATLAGIARAATDAIARRVAARTRTFSHGNAPTYAQDAQIQQVVGEVSAAAHAAEAIALHAAEPAQWAYEAAFTGSREEEKSANIAAEIASAQGQISATALVVPATAKIFDALGASGVGRDWDLDRFWRNARTVASHNPVVFKAKVVGDYEINGTEPVYVWAIGTAPTAEGDKA
ncbi:acyl-CoA dehydrogenase family protein [Rhodococcus sp. T7]|uniref:acyl-CoA dehydrogenase family protein n=1 Tax=Rhodococcus sp. T7 TaxID=627444 RepID=UPI00135A572B|nr:acyl-CoA dehydrogenase family protein [Rhodococcus sp. T7]KAF0958119.1 Dibenzothiophene desulfurization enzyme C [Rhodococcus sp. T7]